MADVDVVLKALQARRSRPFPGQPLFGENTRHPSTVTYYGRHVHYEYRFSNRHLRVYHKDFAWVNVSIGPISSVTHPNRSLYLVVTPKFDAGNPPGSHEAPTRFDAMRWAVRHISSVVRLVRLGVLAPDIPRYMKLGAILDHPKPQ